MRTEIDLSDPGDEPRTFTIRLRKRTDGRASVWFGRLRLSKEERRARAKTGSPYVEVSLRTTDETVAIKNAMEWRRAWNSSGLPKRNQLAGIPSFQTAADRWLEFEQQRALKAKKSGERARSDDQLRRWECSVRRYLVPVFGTLPVNAITRADGERWHSWRTRYYVDGPGAHEVTNEIVYERNGKTIRRPAQPRFADIPASTIGKDADAFAKILAFSRSEYHHLVWNEPISLRRMGPAAETESRDPFSPKERMHIFENASSRAHGFDFEDWEDPQFNREMLYNLVRFLWCTGLRVAEVKRLKVKHVVLNPTKRGKVIYAPKADVTTLGYLLEDVNEAMVESVSQAIAMKDPDAEQYNYQFKFRIDWVKHKRHRRVVTPRLPIYNVMHRHLEQLERMLAAPRRGHRRINDHKDVTKILNALPPELPLFPSESGGPFSTMSRMHDVLLRNTFCDGRATSYSVDGRKMSLSCWRHTYATDLLNDFIERERPNLVEFLARNMGTSTAMIERHYGHILAQAADSDLMV